jgi:hypothetical protein
MASRIKSKRAQTKAKMVGPGKGRAARLRAVSKVPTSAPKAPSSVSGPTMPKMGQKALQRLPGAAGKVAGVAGKALGAVGMVGMAADIAGKLMQTSPGQKAINARIASNASKKAEERANPVKGGLTGDQRLRNARADQARRAEKTRIAKSPASEQRMAEAPSQSSPSTPQPSPSSPQSSKSSLGVARASSKAAPAPEAAGQSKDMDENYAAWTKANRRLAEKVKPNQAGYAAIQKALGKKKKD